MPEGDTVFLAARRMHDALAGKTLLRAELRHPRLSTAELSGLTVLGVRSYGKRMFTRFSSELSLHSHFRMDGAWHLYRPGEKWRRPAHQARAVFEVDDRQAIGFALHDLELLPTSDEDQLISHLGPDLLAEDFDADLAVSRLVAEPDREIGLALLDQRVMAGVGNIYKTEVCFLLGASPWAPVSAVDARRAVSLSRKLLMANRWRPEQITTGDPRNQHYVYGRAGRPCLRCGTRVKGGTQGSGVQERVAYFCPTCQNG
ncbi:Fpg/Nei family DNA glycosylase [Lentzea tibetensis]|uniref:DNA-(apurinic or apyrimidinic site) lyase n=1 Tax=Lentzea tibetensis TaxID=2591470 RepID=A0A563ERD9_9PSEU|nr:DNA-formamidopyrimidine glycosylase family protein [Lentzea tibetensis]TWP50230.1 Fpg/Nei family DNA glycosylase [Lentzea tibetensis]